MQSHLTKTDRILQVIFPRKKNGPPKNQEILPRQKNMCPIGRWRPIQHVTFPQALLHLPHAEILDVNLVCSLESFQVVVKRQEIQVLALSISCFEDTMPPFPSQRSCSDL